MQFVRGEARERDKQERWKREREIRKKGQARSRDTRKNGRKSLKGIKDHNRRISSNEIYLINPFHKEVMQKFGGECPN